VLWRLGHAGLVSQARLASALCFGSWRCCIPRVSAEVNQTSPRAARPVPSPTQLHFVQNFYNNVETLGEAVMEASTQVSAMISPATKERLERYARARGLKKGFLIEAALLHHLAALEHLPADVIVPPRLVVSRASGEALLERLAGAGEPTPAMAELFDDPPRRG